MLHLLGAGLTNPFMPRHQRMVLWRHAVRPHLPNRVMAVRVPTCAAKQVPVQGTSDIRRSGMTKRFGLERDRMIFVDRLAIDHGLGGAATIVFLRFVVASTVFGDVSILAHIEIEPVGIMKILRRALTASGMKRDQVRSTIAGSQSIRHRLDDSALRIVFDRPVAAYDPDDRFVFVSLPQP